VIVNGANEVVVGTLAVALNPVAPWGFVIAIVGTRPTGRDEVAVEIAVMVPVVEIVAIRIATISNRIALFEIVHPVPVIVRGVVEV
jgi:hypothetical protein